MSKAVPPAGDGRPGRASSPEASTPRPRTILELLAVTILLIVGFWLVLGDAPRGPDTATVSPGQTTGTQTSAAGPVGHDDPPPPTPIDAATEPTPTPSTPTTTTALNPLLGTPPAQDEPVEPAGTPVPPGEPAAPRDPIQAQRFAAARDLAARFVTAYSPPRSSTASSWRATISPMLAPRVRELYLAVDPANIPRLTITGDPTVLPTEAPSDLLTMLSVPTNLGAVLIELERSETGHLQVTHIQIPAPRPPR